MNTVTFESNAKQYFPEWPTNIQTLPSGLIEINDIPVGAELTVGFRGYFYKNFGFYTELGRAKSFFQTGLCFRVQ
jgi:hypothetical protein